MEVSIKLHDPCLKLVAFSTEGVRLAKPEVWLKDLRDLLRIRCIHSGITAHLEGVQSVEVTTLSPYTWVRREEVESAVASVDRQVALDTEGKY